MKSSLACLFVVASLSLALPAQPKESAGSVVDSGSFDVTVDGKHVGTETFKIQQQAGRSITSSTIKVLTGDGKAEQSTVLELTSAGELVHYAWRELSPGKAQSTVDVASGSLMQRVMLTDSKKPIETPYMTSTSTAVLENNFYAHHELLVWRFLRGSCGMAEEKLACSPAKLGILIPAQQSMATVSLALVGTEKLPVKGAERELLHIKLSSDDTTWDVWVDPADAYKLMRLTIPASKTEVLRN